jgi:hypothetical protein
MSGISASGTLYFRQIGFNIQYSLDNAIWNFPPGFPLTITNSNPSVTLTVLFTTNITINIGTRYFICGSDNIQFGSTSLNTDGTRPIITISGVTNYSGLIQNTSGYSDIKICNLVVSASGGSKLVDYAGWIAQEEFNGINNWIINCSSDGPIGDALISNCGGIVGGRTGSLSQAVLTIIGCTTSGNINLGGGGGIVGAGCGGFGTSQIAVIECSSSGTIDVISGGIFGGVCSECTATRCYSTGAISGGAGGIFGSEAGLYGSVTATNCYSTGNIGNSGGGIFAEKADQAIANSCYSTGAITSAGGIFGIDFTVNSTAIRCYSSGASSVLNTGGIYYSSGNDNLQGSNNYSEANNSSSGWSDVNAASTLNDIPNPLGSTWISISSNTPYILRNIGFSPYSIYNILESAGPTYSFNTSYSETITQGTSTIVAALPAGYTYDLVVIDSDYPTSYPGITINSTTGQVSTTSSVVPGVYQLFVRNTINPYSVSVFNLTVTLPPAPILNEANQLVIPPCCQITQCVRNSPTTDNTNEALTTYLTGKTIIGNVDSYYNSIKNGTRTFFAEPVFKSYREYMIYLQSQN